MRLRFAWMWLIPILLLTTFLGTVLITYDAIWFDEWITYFITNTGQIGEDPNFYGATTVAEMPICQDFLSHEYHSVAHTLCITALDNSWPPLFFLLLMLWDALVGGVVFVDRTLALFIGLTSVSVTYRMASSMTDKKTGIIASALLGTTVFFTFYLHEVRGYTLYVLMPALNGWLYWRLLKNPQAGRTTRYGFAFSIIGTLYTHYIGIAVVFGIGLYHVLFARPKDLLSSLRTDEEKRPAPSQRWLTILKLYINGCLVYGLWIGVLYISFVNESLNPRSVGTLSLLWSMTTGFSNNLWFISLPMIALSATLIRKDAVRFLWVWGLSILGVAMLANIAADFLFHPRHIIGLMPVFATLVAIGIVYLGQRTSEFVTWGLVAIWMGAGIFYGLSTDFMSNIPEHIDAVPNSVMESITSTAEMCGTDSDTFVFGWNTPEEEWVQDQVVTYYTYDVPVTGVTLSRLINENDDALTYLTGLMPEAVAEGDNATRYDYFIGDAERVFIFYRPHLPIEASLSTLNGLLTSDGFAQCPFIDPSDLMADVYVRDGEMCESVISTCGQ
ncbi:MAG: glycosyltransferase family 39 protein [Chloroflexota bacterium]